MPLSKLAVQVYGVLLARIRTMPRPQITYRDLVKAMEAKTVANNQALVSALGEITDACTTAGLPPIASVAVQASTGMPGPGYFETLHPNAPKDDWGMRHRLDVSSVTRAKASFPDELAVTDEVSVT